MGDTDNSRSFSRVAAIVLAAGSGKRMHSSVKKQFLSIDGKPVLWFSLKLFDEAGINDIILVAGEDDLEYCRTELVEKFGFRKVRSVIAGGKERWNSVENGLAELKRLGYGEGCGVLIHDGARPFADRGILARVIKDAAEYGACTAAMPSKDTIKIADADGFAEVTPDRSRCWIIQTPQAFSCPVIFGAYRKVHENPAFQKMITDDAMIVESMTDLKVRLTEGSYRNIKITTPEDLPVAEMLGKEML